jgi:hypothetical protein
LLQFLVTWCELRLIILMQYNICCQVLNWVQNSRKLEPYIWYAFWNDNNSLPFLNVEDISPVKYIQLPVHIIVWKCSKILQWKNVAKYILWNH